MPLILALNKKKRYFKTMPTTLTTQTSYTPTISVEVCGKHFTLHRAASLEELWDAMTELPCNNKHMAPYDDDERLPYWTELWPSSIALAKWLCSQKHLIQNNICLDIGCGLGLTALVGQMSGAKVLAFDYEQEALHFAQKNTIANAHLVNTSPFWLAMDWRKPAIKKNSIKYLWGGDIMYERKFAHYLLNFIDYALAEAGRAWIAEPCRSVYEHFSAELLHRQWNVKKVHLEKVDAIYAQAVPVTVQVWEIWR